MEQVTGKVVVIGVDFSACGDDAILEGLSMLRDRSAQCLHVLHVLDPRGVLDEAAQSVLESEEEVLERAPTLLRERVEQLAAEAHISLDAEHVRTHARIGRAAETIIQLSADYEADLIVVGTHARRGVDRLLLGSVAGELVRKARCPVLVARPKDYAGIDKTPHPDEPYKPGEAPRYSLPRDVAEHISTEIDSWRPSDAPPTGYRIV